MVIAPKHIRAVLMLILMKLLRLFLRQITCASVGEKRKNAPHIHTKYTVC